MQCRLFIARVISKLLEVNRKRVQVFFNGLLIVILSHSTKCYFYLVPESGTFVYATWSRSWQKNGA